MNVPVLPVPVLDMKEVRSANLKRLDKSRPHGPGLKQNLSDIRGVAPGCTITYTVSPLRTAIGLEAIDAKNIKDKYGLDGGKKKRRKKKKRRGRKNKKKEGRKKEEERR